jgi:hypothetical protein
LTETTSAESVELGSVADEDAEDDDDFGEVGVRAAASADDEIEDSMVDADTEAVEIGAEFNEFEELSCSRSSGEVDRDALPIVAGNATPMLPLLLRLLLLVDDDLLLVEQNTASSSDMRRTGGKDARGAIGRAGGEAGCGCEEKAKGDRAEVTGDDMTMRDCEGFGDWERASDGSRERDSALEPFKKN